MPIYIADDAGPTNSKFVKKLKTPLASQQTKSPTQVIFFYI